MGRPPHATPSQETPWWMPPVPPEHGARSMLAVSLALPLSVSLGVPVDLPLRILVGYLLLSLLAFGVLFVREAARLRLRAPADRQRRFTLLTVGQAIVIVLLAAGLAVLLGPSWGLAVVVIPGALADVWIRQRGVPIPLWEEVSGVLAISLAVPVGAVLLRLGSLDTILLLYAVFVGFHLLGLSRVKTVVSRTRPTAERNQRLDYAVHLAFLLPAGLGWWLDAVGTAVPALFVLSLARAAWLGTRDQAPPIPKLGQGERRFSFVLVAAGPWLLPPPMF